MTRPNKCDACRRAKIKCDETIPRCGGCIHRGRECTRGGVKKELRFIQVAGKIIDEPSDSSGSEVRSQDNEGASDSIGAVPDKRRKIAVITTGRRRKAANAIISHTTENRELAPTSLLQFDLFRRQRGMSLLSRWLQMMPNLQNIAVEQHPMEGYGGWEFHVPPYIGRSRAIDDAARCFLNWWQAVLEPSAANVLAVQTSNARAVSSIRVTLTRGGPRSCTGDILLAIQMLVSVEALFVRTHDASLIHAQGLLCLLNRHKETLRESDSQESLISRAIFFCNFVSGYFTAVTAQRDHELDHLDWLNTRMPSSFKVAGVSNTSVPHMIKCLIHHYILLPRLTRLIRELVTSSADPCTADAPSQHEATALMRHLFFDLNADRYALEAMSSDQLCLQPTTHPAVPTELVPCSYRFGSIRLTIFLTTYWTARMLLCGIIETVVLAGEDIDCGDILTDEEISEVRAADVRCATSALMAAQDTLTKTDNIAHDVKGNAGCSNDTTVQSEQLRLLLALQMGYGSWCRAAKRALLATNAGNSTPYGEDIEALGKAEASILQIGLMKQLTLDLMHVVGKACRTTVSTEAELEVSTLFLSAYPACA
ncbi:hypothetical protein BX600DRAFT_72962 [Xylariales sp. PMI_506]|nr:hypothetical protein BX600DRAFT_72962 [Xylariales sp. PMI_506]